MPGTGSRPPMTDDLTARIAEIVRDHRFAHMTTIPGEGGVIDSYCVCMCQVVCKSITTHVAELAADAAESGPTTEYERGGQCPPQ